MIQWTYKTELSIVQEMSVSFCKHCVDSWKRNKIMDCQLCRVHLNNGWSIKQMYEVYGKRKEVYDMVGLPSDAIVPPAEKREFIQPLAYGKPSWENLLCMLTTQPLPEVVSKKLEPVAKQMRKMHALENKAQWKDFLNQEMKIIYQLKQATTRASKEFFFKGLDPLTQKILLL